MCKEPVITKKTKKKYPSILFLVVLHTLLIRVAGSESRTLALGGDCADSTEKLQRKEKSNVQKSFGKRVRWCK